MSKEINTGDFDEFENALKALRPETQLQRDQVLFRAGQASASRRGWLWPASTITMSAVAAGLSVLLLMRPSPQGVERIVYVPVPATPQIAIAPATAERPPEPPRDVATLTPPAPPTYWTVGSIRDVRFDDWRWRPEHHPDTPATPETSAASQPPTLLNLMNAWVNETNDKNRMR